MAVSLTRSTAAASLVGRPGGSVAPFQLSSTCNDGCALQAVMVDGTLISRPLASLTPDAADLDPTQPLHIGRVSTVDPRSASRRLDLMRTRIARVISTAYRDLMPSLLAL